MAIQHTALKKIRKENQKKALLLLKKGEYYCKDIARSIGLSNVATYDILEDFAKKDIVRIVKQEDTGLGRKPVKYGLNRNYGIFVAIDFTLPFVKVCLHDIFGQTIAFEKFPINTPIDRDELDGFIAQIKRLLKTNDPELPLRNICISTPGRIDSETGYFIIAAIFKNASEVNLRDIFQAEFGCPVLVKNNLYLAFNGEIEKYNLSEYKDVLYLYITESLGGATFLDGKIRNGFHNLAGEVALSTTSDNRPISTRITEKYILLNYHESVQKVAGISEQEREFRLSHNIDDLIDLYENGDAIAEKTLDESANALAVVINNLQSMIDCNAVVIHCYIYYRSNKLQESLRQKLAGLCSMFAHNLIFTRPSDSVFIDGCIHYAIDKNIIATLQLAE